MSFGLRPGWLGSRRPDQRADHRPPAIKAPLSTVCALGYPRDGYPSVLWDLEQAAAMDLEPSLSASFPIPRHAFAAMVAGALTFLPGLPGRIMVRLVTGG